MANILYVDTFEPDNILNGLKAVIPTTVQASINSLGFADYKWMDAKGNQRQWERKQAMEAITDLDAVEDQLNHQLATCDELVLVVEGIALPTTSGVQGYKLERTQGKAFLRQDYHYPVVDKGMRPQPGLYAKYLAWKQGITYAGVQVVETVSVEETIAVLATAFNYSQREEHTTLKRYLTPHIPPFSPNQHIDNLARLKNTGIGLVKAQKLIAETHTFYGAVTAIPEFQDQVLGKATGKKFREVIGRP